MESDLKFLRGIVVSTIASLAMMCEVAEKSNKHNRVTR